MPEISTMIPAPQFLQYAITNLWAAKPLRLCLLSSNASINSQQHLLDLAPVYAAEYDLAGWQRPTLTIPTLTGVYDQNSKTMKLPPLTWQVTSPAAGFSYYQLFVVIGGTAAPHDTTGTFLGLTTQQNYSTIPANITFPVDIAWSVLGFNQ